MGTYSGRVTTTTHNSGRVTTTIRNIWYDMFSQIQMVIYRIALEWLEQGTVEWAYLSWK